MWNNHKLHTNDKGSYIYNNAITLKLSQFMVLFPAFHGLMELEARVKDPVCLRYSPRAGGMECGLVIKLTSDDIEI